MRSDTRPRFIKYLFPLVAACLFLQCQGAPEDQDKKSRGGHEDLKHQLSLIIEREMKEHNVVGLSIALVHDQELLWAEGFGYADKDAGLPATRDTVYRVGSISKLFTATAVMQLAEQGKIDIDRPFKTYVPDFSIKTRFPDGASVTPGNMMTHHSGLPSDLFKGMWTEAPGSLEELNEKASDMHAAFRPDQIFCYSNLAFSLLGLMVQRAEGRDFSSCMEEHVLVPMGMMHSSFSLRPDIEALLSRGYSEGREGRLYGNRDIPAGGLYSNAVDLARFMMMVFAEGRAGENRILKPETLDEMLKPRNIDVPLDLDFRIGLGWFLSDDFGPDAGMTAWHGGETLLFHGILVTLPEQKLGVVVLTNSQEGQKIKHGIAGRSLLLLLDEFAGIEAGAPGETAGSNILSPDELKRFQGYYDTSEGVTHLEMKVGKVITELAGKKVQLVARADGSFALRRLFLGLIPVRDTSLERMKLSFHEIDGHKIMARDGDGKRTLFGTKLEPVPIPESWDSRLGDYEPVDRDGEGIFFRDLSLRKEHGFLIADMTLVYFSNELDMELALSPLSDTRAFTMGLGRMRGDTMEVVKVEGRDMILFSGYEFSKN